MSDADRSPADDMREEQRATVPVWYDRADRASRLGDIDPSEYR